MLLPFRMSFFLLSFSVFSYSQPSRIVTPIDAKLLVKLRGSIRPATLLKNDLGRMDSKAPLAPMILLLRSSARQQADLQQLLDDLHDSASPLYHQWLTPEQFGDRFGVSASDIATTTNWLRAHGFEVGNAGRGRRWIVFSGTTQQVEQAFRIEIHRYSFGGKMHYAAALAPSIPNAIANVVAGIEGLDDFSFEEQPEMTSPTGVHTLTPDDLAIIYDIASVYQSGIDGTGQKIAVVGTTQFDSFALSDVATFRSKFNLPPNVPQVMRDPNFPDPGLNSSSLNEAHLDVEWTGATARNAQILFVYSNTFVHAVLYAVDNNLAPIITMSANSGCEAANTSATASFYQNVAQQANAQGITWVNSGSDAGPASCDANGAPIATGGLSVRFPASIPEVTAVGGTEFNERGGTFWSATNTANGASALSYVPEMAWNDSSALSALWAGGGGTSIYFSKPSWQAGAGVPNDSARDVPDLALAASFSHDGYYVYRNGAVVTTGGTSASAPVFAGILALLNHYLIANGAQSQPGLGNVNRTLYKLAAVSGVFHDITTGDNVVQCQKGTPDCPNGSMGFSAGAGYDLASGLGSVDVANFLKNWNSIPRPPAGPTVYSGGIVNAASYTVINGAGAPAAPGSLVAIFTSTLDTQPASFSGTSLPSSLSGVTVAFDHITAPIVSVFPNGAYPFVAAQVPFEVTGANVHVVVAVNGLASIAVQEPIVPSAPGIFTIPPTGQGNAVLVFMDPATKVATIAGPANASLGYPSAPIPRGTNAFFYVNGLGTMSPAVADGSGVCPAPDGICKAIGQPTVQIGGANATVQFAGQAPGFPGVFQVNIIVPPNAPTGNNVSLVVKSADGSVTSNTAIVAVQ